MQLLSQSHYFSFLCRIIWAYDISCLRITACVQLYMFSLDKVLTEDE